ncbi:MAG TPA: hypothetical protein DEP85_08485, partial [Holosporales bacterium]|nr:hypothetical protein [Holosporales bacterium]
AKELAAEKTEITAPPLMENLAEKKDKKPVAKAEKKKEKKVTKKSETEKKTSKEVAFDWPVKGEVISSFSPGDKNDGINIKVPEGTPVKAAADGTVMYAGNELKGFGNLLLIKHRDGWVTAYAHNSDLLVKKGDKVVQGQAIAKSGTPDAIKKGDVPEPQLHFEIRKVKQPVDPLTKLKS